MRKPLVVVCVTASAVLLAGAIAATTAGAETTPDEPVAGVAGLPDIPGIPQLPVDPDEPGEAPARPGVPGVDLPDFDQPAAEVPADAGPAGDGPAGDDPAGDNPAGDDPADADPAAGDPDQAAADVPQRPGGAAAELPHTKPAQGRPAQAKPAADEPTQNLRADVTPSMVSGSTTAPVQRQVLTLVNENRRRGGCGNLTLDRRLIAAANRHAAEMARRGYFAHDSLNGEGAGDRVEDAGYRWKRYGENIARGQESAYEVVDGWMHSPAHRENIMDCQLQQMGIGLAFASDRTPYWVQDFATPH
jgi:uncharacterized protein YkwD